MPIRRNALQINNTRQDVNVSSRIGFLFSAVISSLLSFCMKVFCSAWFSFWYWQVRHMTYFTPSRSVSIWCSIWEIINFQPFNFFIWFRRKIFTVFSVFFLYEWQKSIILRRVQVRWYSWLFAWNTRHFNTMGCTWACFSFSCISTYEKLCGNSRGKWLKFGSVKKRKNYWHYILVQEFSKYRMMFILSAPIAVDTFFVISGLLVSINMLKHFQKK